MCITFHTAYHEHCITLLLGALRLHALHNVCTDFEFICSYPTKVTNFPKKNLHFTPLLRFMEYANHVLLQYSLSKTTKQKVSFTIIVLKPS